MKLSHRMYEHIENICRAPVLCHLGMFAREALCDMLSAVQQIYVMFLQQHSKLCCLRVCIFQQDRSAPTVLSV